MTDDDETGEKPVEKKSRRKLTTKKKDKIPLLNELNDILGLEYGIVDWRKLKADELATILEALKSDAVVLSLIENAENLGNLAVKMFQQKAGNYEFPRLRQFMDRVKRETPDD